jgi:hypothetical protein
VGLSEGQVYEDSRRSICLSPCTGKTKRPHANVDTEPLDISRCVEMAGQKRSECLRSIVVLVRVLKRLTKIVTPSLLEFEMRPPDARRITYPRRNRPLDPPCSTA